MDGPFSDAELEALLVRIRDFNLERGVTGLLLYDYVPGLGVAQFCQYVEGPPPAVALVRRRVEADQRHTGITYLDEGRTRERLFSDWSMGYIPRSALPDVAGFRDPASLIIPKAGPQLKPAVLMSVFLDMSNRSQR